MDGSGTTQTEAKLIGDEYFAHGCILNRAGVSGLPGQIAAINGNALFDAARRMTQCVRLLNRHQFVGYAVEVENGTQKSVLWFKRRSIYSRDIDLFDGIADAIATEAPQRGWTNEWLLGVHLKPYHPSDSSIWKLNTHGDYWNILNRCMTLDPDIGYLHPDWLWQVAYGQSANNKNLIAEAPSGYNYGKLGLLQGNINSKECWGDPDCEAARIAFYKSCRVYEPDLEIERAQTVTESGTELVKITLTGRLRNTYGEASGAPETIDRDTSGWDGPTIASEPFRTPENGLRLYLLMSQTGYNPPRTQGDLSQNYDESFSDDPFASIVPHFTFVKLIPKPYTDANDVQDPSDTPLWSDVWPMMDLYLRAMCEGYVDEASTIARNACEIVQDPGPDEILGTDDDGLPSCTSNGYDIFDYTYETLCVQAFGQSSMGFVQAATRPDAPTGFGPLPNTEATAEMFNRMAAAVDLLDKARVMLPYKLEARQLLYASDTLELTPGECSCDTSDCGSAYIFAWYGTGLPAGGAAISDTGWVDLGAGESVYGFTYCEMGGCVSFTNYGMNTRQMVGHFRFALVDPDAEHAIPESWRDMFMVQAGTIFCQTVYTVRYISGPGTELECYPGKSFTCDIKREVVQNYAGCVFLEAGSIDRGRIPLKSWHYYGTDGAPAPQVCAGNPSSYEWLTPLSDTTLYLRVPIVDTDDA